MSGLLNPKHLEQYLATSGLVIDLWEEEKKKRKEGGKRLEVVKQRWNGFHTEGIIETGEKFGSNDFKVSLQI